MNIYAYNYCNVTLFYYPVSLKNAPKKMNDDVLCVHFFGKCNKINIKIKPTIYSKRMWARKEIKVFF